MKIDLKSLNDQIVSITVNNTKGGTPYVEISIYKINRVLEGSYTKDLLATALVNPEEIEPAINSITRLCKIWKK